MSKQAVAAANAVAPVKKKKIPSLDRRKARAGWLFTLPFIIGFVVIYIPIIFESIKYSLFTYKLVEGGMLKEFVGWEHYQAALFEKANFLQTLLTGLEELVFDVPAILIFSLFIAVILNQKMAGRAAFRVIFFLPVMVSTGIMESIVASSHSMAGAGMDLGMGDAGAAAGDAAAGAEGEAAATGANNMALEGMLTSIFQNLGVGEGLITYIIGAVGNIASIVNRSGVQILIFLAALQSISPAIYESCQIDGATGWETFWKITFPMVSPMILVNGIYTIIDNFTTDSNSVMNVINQTFVSPGAGKHISAAMGWMYFLLILLIVGIVAAVFSAYVFYQRRD